MKGNFYEMKMRCIYPFTNSRREGVKNKQFIKILEFIFQTITDKIGILFSMRSFWRVFSLVALHGDENSHDP